MRYIFSPFSPLCVTSVGRARVWLHRCAIKTRVPGLNGLMYIYSRKVDFEGIFSAGDAVTEWFTSPGYTVEVLYSNYRCACVYIG